MPAAETGTSGGRRHEGPPTGQGTYCGRARSAAVSSTFDGIASAAAAAIVTLVVFVVVALAVGAAIGAAGGDGLAVLAGSIGAAVFACALLYALMRGMLRN